MHFKSISEISEEIMRKKITSSEVTSRILERISIRDAKSCSYITVTAERAMQQAAVADKEISQGLWRGPLHGVPLGIKDIIYTDFAKTTAGTAIHRDFRPTFNATVVNRLETAGAVTLGKLTTTEQAFADHHPSVKAAVNPFGEEYYSGVSSSGSGVSVADGLAYGSLGSDTGGSIRAPSGANNITGVKPTWGRVSRHGVFALADSLDHIGPMARSAVDAAIMLGAIAGQDSNDPTALRAAVPDYLSACAAGIQGLRIGMPRAFACENTEQEISNAWQYTADVLCSLGAETRDITFPEWRKAVADWIALCSPETARAHQEFYPSRKDEYGPVLANFIETGRKLSAIDYVNANLGRIAFSALYRKLFSEVDIFLIPVFPRALPKASEWLEIADSQFIDFTRFFIPADITGSPTVTFPVGADRNGMPIAMQVCGPHLSEDVLLKVVANFQRVTSHHLRRPVD
ncbi:amidase [Agrobacterium sp. NPDC090283]|uniref:amidase n=1 Tax=Agrobacterium sp. NPDC090283 TaxID=3363920 RepID=UPI00383BA87D